jgi:ribosomal protein S13
MARNMLSEAGCASSISVDGRQQIIATEIDRQTEIDQQKRLSELDQQNTDDLRTILKILVLVERAFLAEPDEPDRRSSLDKKIVNRQQLQEWLKNFR